MKVEDILERDLYLDLQDRYEWMACGTKSEYRVIMMMKEVVKNHDSWPKDKTGRWVGYVQCLLIEVEEVTTTEEERNYTRPLFHKLYETMGYDIPETIEIPTGHHINNR